MIGKKIKNYGLIFVIKKKIEPAKLALKYVLQKKNVDKIILGFDSKDQLVNILNMNNKKIKFNYPKFKKVDRIINPYMWF